MSERLNVTELLEKASHSTREQVAAMLAEEEASDHPRVTAVDGLKTRLEELEEKYGKTEESALVDDDGEPVTVPSPDGPLIIGETQLLVPGTASAENALKNPTSLEQVEERQGVQTDHDSHDPPFADAVHAEPGVMHHAAGDYAHLITTCGIQRVGPHGNVIVDATVKTSAVTCERCLAVI